MSGPERGRPRFETGAMSSPIGSPRPRSPRGPWGRPPAPPGPGRGNRPAAKGHRPGRIGLAGRTGTVGLIDQPATQVGELEHSCLQVDPAFQAAEVQAADRRAGQVRRAPHGVGLHVVESSSGTLAVASSARRPETGTACALRLDDDSTSAIACSSSTSRTWRLPASHCGRNGPFGGRADGSSGWSPSARSSGPALEGDAADDRPVHSARARGTRQVEPCGFKAIRKVGRAADPVPDSRAIELPRGRQGAQIEPIEPQRQSMTDRLMGEISVPATVPRPPAIRARTSSSPTPLSRIVTRRFALSPTSPRFGMATASSRGSRSSGHPLGPIPQEAGRRPGRPRPALRDRR